VFDSGITKNISTDIAYVNNVMSQMMPMWMNGDGMTYRQRIAGQRPETAPWHYVDIPVGAQGSMLLATERMAIT
jgi:hypothetical protein